VLIHRECYNLSFDLKFRRNHEQNEVEEEIPQDEEVIAEENHPASILNSKSMDRKGFWMKDQYTPCIY
jgi:hypothetical protein